jgi:hypothetical protein
MLRPKRAREFVAPPGPRISEAPTTAPQPLLVDIRTAALMLSTTVWAVRQLLWGKKLPYLKLGKKFVIDPQDLRSFIAKQKGEAA